MKKLLVLLLLPIASHADQNNNDTNQQSNESSTNSYGSLANYQINNNNHTRHRIGDVECSAPSVDIGATDREGGNNTMMAYASITIPLAGKTCRKAQEARLRRMNIEMEVAQIEQKKRDEIFINKMKSDQRKLQLSLVENKRQEILFKDRLTRICDQLNGSEHHQLLEECHPHSL